MSSILSKGLVCKKILSSNYNGYRKTVKRSDPALPFSLPKVYTLSDNAGGNFPFSLYGFVLL